MSRSGHQAARVSQRICSRLIETPTFHSGVAERQSSGVSGNDILLSPVALEEPAFHKKELARRHTKKAGNTGTLDLARVAESLSPKPRDSKTLLGVIIENSLLAQEAERRGIKPTDQEIDEYVNAIKTEFDNARKLGLEGAKEFDELVRGTGLTEDQYWAAQKPGYARALSVSKLREMVFKEAGIEKLPVAGRPQAQSLAMNNLKTSLKAQARIEILATSLK